MRKNFYSILGQNIWPHSCHPFSYFPQHLILEKVSEDEELRKRITHSAETRVPRKQPISVRREEVTEPGAAGEPALWKNTSASMEQASPLADPSCKGGGDMAIVGPEEGSWEKPNGDSSQKSGAQPSPEMSMFESMYQRGSP